MNWIQAQPESVNALESGARRLAAAGAKVHEVEMRLCSPTLINHST